MAERFVLIDVDAGLDDAVALFMAIRAHQTPSFNFRIVGITCVNGNTGVGNVVNNVSQVLHVMKENGKIPLFRGAENSILPYSHEIGLVPHHGHNGFGDVELPPVSVSLHKEHAVTAIIRLANQYKGSLTLVMLGPLTNLALALRQDPTIASAFKDVFIMGGNIEGVGNRTPCAEFNFLVDPEAAFITLDTLKCPTVIVPWEVCRRSGLQTLEWRMNDLGKINTPQIQMMNAIEKERMPQTTLRNGGWLACDCLVVAALMEPRLILEQTKHYCSVELGGNFTRGQMIVDRRLMLGKTENVTVYTKLNREKIREMIIWGLGGGTKYPY